MNKCLQLLSFLIALSSAATSQSIVRVSRTLCDNRPIFFSYQDYFDDQIIHHQLKRDSSWYLIKTQTPVMLVFSRGLSLHPVYAFPGDTIRVTCTSDPLLPYSFAGNKSWPVLNALTIVNARNELLFPAMDVKITKRLNLTYRANKLDSLYRKQSHIIDSLIGAPDQKQQDFLQRTCYFRKLTNMLSPFYRSDNEIEWRDIPGPYLQMVDSFSHAIGWDSTASERMYRTFIWNYNKYLIRDAPNPQLNYQAMFQTAIHFFSGPSRDYLLFTTTKNYINTVQSESDSLLISFRMECRNQRFVAYIDSLLEKRRDLTVEAKMLRTPLGTPQGKSIDFHELLSYHLGKFLYIDFWASWCGPCIYEIPFLKEAERKFGEQIDFVSISIDSDLTKWESAMRKHKTGDQNQFVLDRESELAKYLKLDAIPRFMLISPDGKVISWDAPRPSDQQGMDKLLRGTQQGR